MTCVVHGRHCLPAQHCPGGDPKKGLLPFRPGKTRRDLESGATARRYMNRRSDPGRNAQ